MNIYKLNSKETTKVLMSFNHTNYGKVVFLLAYSIPMMIIVGIIAAIVTMPSWYDPYLSKPILLKVLPIIFLIFLVSFIVGSAYLYRELRVYVETLEEKPKTQPRKKAQ